MSDIQELIQQDGGELVFTHFGVNTDTSRKQANPLRQNSKNFSVKLINGVFIFQDWVTGEKGNAVKFLELITNSTYKDACQAVEMLYNNHSFPIKPIQKKIHKKELPTKYLEGKDLSCLKNQNSAFHLFCEKIGIPKSHLQKWNVGTIFQKTAFVYQNKEGKYLNIKSVSYNPKTGKRNSDFSTLKPTNYHKYELCLFGEHLLGKDKKIVLVESEKTAVIASWFYPQFDFLSLGSSNGLTNQKIPTLFNRELIFISDSDKAGRNNTSIDLIREYGLRCAFVDLFPEKNCGYDLADYIIDNIEKYHFSDKLQIDRQTLFHCNNYLSELLENESFKTLIDAQNVKLNFKAGTGSGKTTLAKLIGKHWHSTTGKKTIIAFPLNSIAESKYYESKQQDETIPYFVSSHFKQSSMLQTIYEIEQSNVMYSNYDALPKLCEIIGEGNYHLIIDEQHCINRDFGFRADKVGKLFDLANQSKKCILFSADTIQYGFENYTTIEVLQNKPKRKVTNIKVKDTHKIQDCIIERVKLTQGKCVVLLNSKKRIEEVKSVLEQYGKSVHCIWSDNSLRTDTHYQTMMKEKTLPQNIDVLLCTSVIATGIDLYVNEDITLIYAENNFGFDETLCNQFFARVRNFERVKYETISILNTNGYIQINPNKLYLDKIKQLERIAKTFKDDEEYLYSFPIKTSFSEVLQVFYKNDNKIEIDKLAVGYWVTKQVIANGSPDTLSDSFILYQDAQNKKELKISKEKIKKTRIENEAIVYDLFKNQKTELAVALLSFTQDIALKQKIISHFRTSEKIIPQQMIQSDAIASIAENVLKRCFRLLELGVDETDLQHLIFDEEKKLRTNAYFYSNIQAIKINIIELVPKESLPEIEKTQTVQFNKIKQSLAKQFERFGEMTNKEIQAVINQYYTLKLTCNQTTQLCKAFFDLKESVRTKNNEKVRYYKVLEEKSLYSVCKHLNLNENSIRQYIQSELERSRREVENLLQSKNKSIHKDSKNLLCSKDDDFGKWFYENYTAFMPEIRLEALPTTQIKDFRLQYDDWIYKNSLKHYPF